MGRLEEFLRRNREPMDYEGGRPIYTNRSSRKAQEEYRKYQRRRRRLKKFESVETRNIIGDPYQLFERCGCKPLERVVMPRSYRQAVDHGLQSDSGQRRHQIEYRNEQIHDVCYRTGDTVPLRFTIILLHTDAFPTDNESILVPSVSRCHYTYKNVRKTAVLNFNIKFGHRISDPYESDTLPNGINT